MNEPDITLIIGTTGIGKTDYSLDLAKKMGAEIISADAFQVYRNLDIGTDKVSLSTRNSIPHHLIDIKNPDEPYSVAEFLQLAQDCIQAIRSRNKSILICGGTALYLRAFLYNYTLPETQYDPQLRATLEKEYLLHGLRPLWERLHDIDPVMADAIDSNNHRRVIRALEIFELTQKKPSELRLHSDTPRSDCNIIGLTSDREHIYDRINHRVDRMYQKGLVSEVKGILDQGYSATCQAFQAIGYKETIQHLESGLSYEEMLELVKRRTRHFAKRQLTWFRKFDDVTWIKVAKDTYNS